jgi:hypothetical protein
MATHCGRYRNSRGSLAPLWLTALGRDAYWPTALLNLADPKHPNPTISHMPHVVQVQRNTLGDKEGKKVGSNQLGEHAPQSWIVLCYAVLILGLMFTALCWNGTIFSGSDYFARFSPADSESRGVVIAIGALLLQLMVQLTLWPWQRWGWEPAPGVWMPIMTGLLALLLIGTALDLRRRNADRALKVFLVLATLFLVLQGWLGKFGADPSTNLSVFRYIHITSGVSVLPPFLFLIGAGLWWCWQTLG